MDGATARLLWAGVAAAVWYTAVVLIGVLATPGYSHIGEHVSTLYQSGAPNGMWIAALFAGYNVLILAFGVGVFRLVSDRGGVRRRNGQAGGAALVLTAIAGIMDVVFRQDPIGSPATTPGMLHVAFAGVASLFTIVGIALVANWALARPELRGFGRYSVATLVVIVVSGPTRRRRHGGPVADDGPARADPDLRLRPVGRCHLDHPRPVAACRRHPAQGSLRAPVVDRPPGPGSGGGLDLAAWTRTRPVPGPSCSGSRGAGRCSLVAGPQTLFARITGRTSCVTSSATPGGSTRIGTPRGASV